MRLLTKDNRLLTLLSIGEPNAKSGLVPNKGSTQLQCKTDNGKRLIISVHEVACFLGSYIFPLDNNR